MEHTHLFVQPVTRIWQGCGAWALVLATYSLHWRFPKAFRIQNYHKPRVLPQPSVGWPIFKFWFLWFILWRGSHGWSWAPSSSCHCTRTADLTEMCAEVSPQVSEWPLAFSTGSSASCLPQQWKRTLQHSWKLQWGPQREPALQTPYLTVRMQKFENLLM